MYLVNESIVDGKVNGYFVHEKIGGKLITSYFIDEHLKSCSCKHFADSRNPYNHFHINLVKNWLKNNKPQCAMYAKSKTGKIVTLCPGFVKASKP